MKTEKEIIEQIKDAEARNAYGEYQALKWVLRDDPKPPKLPNKIKSRAGLLQSDRDWQITVQSTINELIHYLQYKENTNENHS